VVNEGVIEANLRDPPLGARALTSSKGSSAPYLQDPFIATPDTKGIVSNISFEIAGESKFLLIL
jgi:hypothetical protein